MKNKYVFVLWVLLFSIGLVNCGGSSSSSSSSSGSGSSSGSSSSGGAGTKDVKIHKNNYVARLVVPKSVFDTSKAMSRASAQALSKKIYQFFYDKYDMIFFVSNNKNKPANIYFGINFSVKNAVKGIGGGTFDGSSDFGSAGKLKSVIHFPYRDAIKFGPSLHEVAHNWANRLLPSKVGGHWGYTGFEGGKGQLGGYDANTLSTLTGNLAGGTFQANNFGTFANFGNSIAYNDIELYLMGMIDKPTSNIYLAQNARTILNPPTGKRQFSADKITKIAFDQYLTLKNIPDRDPPFSTAQKSFKVLTVLVSNQETTDKELEEVDATIQWFSKSGDDGNSSNNFNEATGFRGTIVAGQIDQDLK